MSTIEPLEDVNKEAKAVSKSIGELKDKEKELKDSKPKREMRFG